MSMHLLPRQGGQGPHEEDEGGQAHCKGCRCEEGRRQGRGKDASTWSGQQGVKAGRAALRDGVLKASGMKGLDAQLAHSIPIR